MFFDYLSVFIPLVCLLINIITQVCSLRIIKKLGLLKAEFLGFTIGFLILVILEFYILLNSSFPIGQFIGIFFVDALTYTLLGYGFFHFVNLGETARRIRILRELYESSNGLTMQELLNKYNTKEIIDKRITRLISNGQIVLKDNKYFIANPTMLLIARIIVFMKETFLTSRRY
jgi:hypothetical protein